MSDVTHILDRAQSGDPKATAELLPLVYEELRRLTAIRMASKPAGQTLQATALVHEAWLRLVEMGSGMTHGALLVTLRNKLARHWPLSANAPSASAR